MPWEEGATKQGGLKGRERSARRLTPSSPGSLAAFQAAWRIGLFTQGIGLRPQMLCRVEGSQWRAEGL